MPPVPFVSQIDNSPGRNDCGAACVLMLGRWNGKGATVTPDMLAAQIGKLGKTTNAVDLVAMAGKLGLTGMQGGLPYPFIQLVQYNKLPNQNPTFAGGTFLHWIVRLSATTYHDPLWTGNKGESLFGSEAALNAAEAGTANRTGVKERPSLARDEGQAREAYERVYHVIHAGATEDEAVAVFRAAWRAGRQTVGGSYDDAGLGSGLKSKKAILYGIPAGNRASFTQFFQQWYPTTTVSFVGDTPTPPPPPTPTTTAAIGLNVLNPSSDANATLNAAFDAGCRHFLVIDDELAAKRIAGQGGTVLFRRWIANQLPSPDDMASRLKAAIAPGVILTGLNEADSIGNWSADDISKRAAWDVQVAARVRSLGGVYAAGTISVGNPGVPAPDVCAAMRAGYADGYNRGDYLFDYHSYSPNMNFEAEGDWRYHGRRWEYFFTHCGFDPARRGIVSGETGVDEGGVGGFPGHGAGSDRVIAWGRKFQEVQARPCMGKPSPFLFGVIFQASNSGQWAGYDVRGYMSALSVSFWKVGAGARAMEINPPREYVFGDLDINAQYAYPDGATESEGEAAQ